ncbi:BHLH transcription factor [Rhynchospora pubera]|uniref:BHLH transcription factor n=1 Tax=Rhynchospora pubera TaxID=906938 RepID=A0AAV8G7Q7_9POAL|nr:BHLH transcription factor [Rhynchospora pubera]
MWEESFHTPTNSFLLASGGEASALTWPPALLPSVHPISSPYFTTPHLPFAAEHQFGYDGAIFGACADQTGIYDGVLHGKGLGPMSLFGTLHAEFGKMTAKEMMDAKALAASKSHSEAERRRRQRINGHLARLRSMLPNTTKTDKASLLAEVIEHVKELKRQTSAITTEEDGQALPTEADELTVDPTSDPEGNLLVRASLCCEDRADLIPDLVRTLKSLKLRTRKAEITTLGGRVKNVLIIAGEDSASDVSFGQHHEYIASIQEALRSVMDRKATSSDSSSSSGGIKRQRMNNVQEQGSI